jgi:deazaflavin-dependent oxidoreductase (nitroreductase family)
MVYMQLPQWLARFNRHVTNPIQRMWAGWAATMGILEHVGRKSGKPYRTPLTVFSTDDGVAILLSYGPNRDWLKNIVAAGGARIKRYGKTFDVHDPRVMPKAQAAPAVTGWMRPLYRLLPFEQAVLLKRV